MRFPKGRTHRRFFCDTGMHGVAAVLAFLLLTACSAPRPVVVAPPAEPALADSGPRPETEIGRKAASLAHSLVGRPYCWGGETPDCFDCSGLIHYVYGQAGVAVPRTSREQLQLARRIALEELAAGDLLFFSLVDSGKKSSHVGLYAAGSLFIHAPSAGQTVSYASLENPYWRERLVSAGRLY